MTTSLIKSFDVLAREEWGQDFGSAAALAEFGINRGHIQKAMASQPVGGASFGDFTALRLEDLDPTMVSVLFKGVHLKLQRWLPRAVARQVQWEYNVQKDYGSMRGAAGFAEGRGPAGGNSSFERRIANIMFLGRQGGLTHQSSVQGPGMQLDPVAKENSDRTMELLGTVEREMIWGDQDFKDQNANTVMYDGLFRQIKNGWRDVSGTLIAPQDTATNVINMKGNPINFDVLEQIGYVLADQRFVLSFDKVKAFMGGAVASDFATLLRQADRRVLGGQGSQPDGGYVPGAPAKGFLTQFGYIPFEHSTFMDPVPGKRPLVSGTTEGVSPLAGATINSVTAGAGGNGELPAATYYYAVSAVYTGGETLASAASSGAVVTTVNNQVVVSVARPSATPDASLRGYRLYRGTTNVVADMRWVANVADPRVGTNFTALTDTNQIIPGTDIMLVLEGSPENIAVPQLAPLMRFNLPPVETTLPFYLLLYHTLVVKVPTRQFLVYNIGRL